MSADPEKCANEPTRPAVESAERLRQLYRHPTEAIANKARPVIDESVLEFLAASPFCVIATTSAAGADASPRGGPPGFVVALDEHRLAFADLSGNNRLDSFTNLLSRPDVGLLFLVPGVGETLRVNGRGALTTDPEILSATAIDGVRPKVAVVVEVSECFIHCAKAIRRSGLWDPESWAPADERVRAANVVIGQFRLAVSPEAIEQRLEEGYASDLWVEGGA